MEESLRETFENEKQAENTLKKSRPFFQVSEATSVCESWRSKSKNLAKEKVESIC